MGKRSGWAATGLVVGWAFATAMALTGHVDPVQAVGVGFLVGGFPGLFLGYLGSLIQDTLTAPRALPPVSTPAPAWPVPAVAANIDLWSGMVLRCEGSVGRVVAAVQTVPNSPAKEWMSRIAWHFQQELAHVHDIARLARALNATDRDHPAVQRLLTATQDFAAFESEVGLVALKLLDNPELARARTDLEFLEQQFPHLKS